MGVVIMAIIAGAAAIAALSERPPAPRDGNAPGPDRPTGPANRGESVAHAADGQILEVTQTEGGPVVNLDSVAGAGIVGLQHSPNGASVLTAPSHTARMMTAVATIRTAGLTSAGISDAIRDVGQRTNALVW